MFMLWKYQPVWLTMVHPIYHRALESLVIRWCWYVASISWRWKLVNPTCRHQCLLRKKMKLELYMRKIALWSSQFWIEKLLGGS